MVGPISIMPFFGWFDVTFLTVFMVGVTSDSRKQGLLAGLWVLFTLVEVLGLA